MGNAEFCIDGAVQFDESIIHEVEHKAFCVPKDGIVAHHMGLKRPGRAHGGEITDRLPVPVIIILR